MSLRQIAKELGISPAYLSYMVNGKRPWRKDLYQRYMRVVNTFVNSDVVGEEIQLEVGEGITPSQEEKSMERAMGFEPTTSCLGSKHSTPELRPLSVGDCTIFEAKYPHILVGAAKSPLTGKGVASHFAPLWLESSRQRRFQILALSSRRWCENGSSNP